MDPTIPLGALLLLASLITVVADPSEPLAAETGGPECEFLDFDDEFPFIIIDLTCPPVRQPVAAAF